MQIGEIRFDAVGQHETFVPAIVRLAHRRLDAELNRHAAGELVGPPGDHQDRVDRADQPAGQAASQTAADQHGDEQVAIDREAEPAGGLGVVADDAGPDRAGEEGVQVVDETGLGFPIPSR